jgi:hypothetical protein
MKRKKTEKQTEGPEPRQHMLTICGYSAHFFFMIFFLFSHPLIAPCELTAFFFSFFILSLISAPGGASGVRVKLTALVALFAVRMLSSLVLASVGSVGPASLLMASTHMLT